MLNCRQVNTSLFSSLPAVILLAFITFSCTVPRKYQAGKPFVFQTNIDVKGNLKLSERVEMENRLYNQLDDSLKTRVVSFAGIRKTLISPAVFDTVYATRTVNYMNSLLNAMGYYDATILWDSTLKKVGKQQRVTVNFDITPGKHLRFDSVNYVLSDTALQRLTDEHREASLLKKGDPYSQQIVAAELDRLIEIYKDNGYYKISREDLYAEHDTVVAALINPELDPFEQIRLLEEVRARRENPTINVVIKQRTQNPVHLQQYTIGNVTIYPDLRLLEDTTRILFDTARVRRMYIVSSENLFKPRFLARNTSLLPGRLYQISDYYETVNDFSQLGAWDQVNVELIPNDSLAQLDVRIDLFPGKKQNLSIDLETTRSSGDVIAQSNLFGLGFNVGVRNRNLGKESIQSITNLRAGVELGTKTRLIQTLQGSFEKNIYLPRFILPFRIPQERRLNSSRTVFKFNASYVDRRDFFTLGSVTGSVGYEWTRKNKSWQYTPFNIEYIRVGERDSLDKLLRAIPNLRFSFQDGLIVSQFLNFTVLGSHNNKRSRLRIGLEESGALFGLVKSIDRRGGLFRFVKMDVDYRHAIDFNSTSLAFRAYAGAGVPYGKQRDGSPETSLPFIRSFFAGGPNSMRAWQVRRLGPGSSDTLQTFDRFGEIALEGNVEFRFDLFSIGGVKLESALFTDIGNVWNRTDLDDPKLENTDFKLTRLYQDIAVAGGTGLRVDFDYFLIRFDWAYKLKDPRYWEENYGWFHDLSIGSGQFQLGINYPF